jgi:lycopene cyclase domain-containing protein
MMQFEYLLFNILVISGPLLFGTLRRFYFLDRVKQAFGAIFIISIPYIIWDVLVTNSHWKFNERFILGIKIAGLPIEEILFFITVPFACLFTWEMITRILPDVRTNAGIFIQRMLYFFPVLGIWLFISGRQYTGLVLIFLALAVTLDKILGTGLVYLRRFYWYLLAIIVFTLLFNGYLTWRPVVLYGEAYQLGFRIFTIPIEDFGYGVSLLFLCTILYEKFKNKKASLLAETKTT